MAEMDSTAVHVYLRGAELTATAMYRLMQSLLHKATVIQKTSSSTFREKSHNYETVQIKDENIKDIKSELKDSYSIDFQIIKDKQTNEFSVLFKGKDIQQIYEGLSKYMSKQAVSKKQSKKSIKEVIKDAVREAKLQNEKVVSREPKSREHER